MPSPESAFVTHDIQTCVTGRDIDSTVDLYAEAIIFTAIEYSSNAIIGDTYLDPQNVTVIPSAPPDVPTCRQTSSQHRRVSIRIVIPGITVGDIEATTFGIVIRIGSIDRITAQRASIGDAPISKSLSYHRHTAEAEVAVSNIAAESAVLIPTR